MRTHLLLLSILVTSSCVAAEANGKSAMQPFEVKVNCQAPRNEDEKLICLSAEYIKNDTELDRLYQRSLLIFERPNSKESNFNEAREALIQAQRSWHNFVLMQCHIPAALNTTIEPSARGGMVISCQLDLTIKRINDFKALQAHPER